MKTQYDVFISYRRTAFETASLIANKLRLMGYRVFLDVETLRSGKFNEQLYSVIDTCKDFIVVLPPNALDRCNEPEDWVRKELIRAFEGKKNIIPIMLSGFEWPNPMPQDLEELALYQSVIAGEKEFFDMSINRLVGYMHSKPHKDINKLLTRSAIFMVSLLILVVIAVGIFKRMAIPVCKEVAENVTLNMCIVHEAGAYMDQAMECWTFMEEGWSHVTPEEFKALFDQTIQKLEIVDDCLETVSSYVDTSYRLNDFQSFLLRMYHISPSDCEIYPEYARLTIDAVRADIRFMKQKIAMYDITMSDMAMKEAQYELSKCNINSTFYIYMALMSDFPEEAVTSYYDISYQWEVFPTGVAMGLDKKEYMNFYKQEIEKSLDYLYRMQALMFKENIELKELDIRLTALERQLQQAEELFGIHVE